MPILPEFQRQPRSTQQVLEDLAIRFDELERTRAIGLISVPFGGNFGTILTKEEQPQNILADTQVQEGESA